MKSITKILYSYVKQNKRYTARARSDQVARPKPEVINQAPNN